MTYQRIKQAAIKTGIWDGDRKRTHAFRLSDSVYRITPEQAEELRRLGHALQDCLLGISHMATIAYNDSLNYRGVWQYLRQIFSTGVPRQYHPLQGLNIKDTPKLLKVDIMVDIDGKFQIAEIDGHNKHGLGYSTLSMHMRNANGTTGETLPGAVATLAEHLHKQGNTSLCILYGDNERFYLPEFSIAANEFSKHGIACSVVSEIDMEESTIPGGLFLDLPFLYKRTALHQPLSDGYKSGNVRFVIPPKPFLGAKAVLAVLRNDTHNEDVEAALRTFIKKEALELVRSYIPETLLVGRKATSEPEIQSKLQNGNRYVLKESISSGMRGTVFSDDPEFASELRRAANTNMNWILQSEVQNQPQTFSWFEETASGEVRKHTNSNWYMRVTVQYIGHTLGDIIVTARQDKAVHGSKDCLQLGTIIC